MARTRERVVFESFGVVVEVATDPGLVESLEDVLPPDRRPADREATARFELTRAGAVTLDGAEVARADADRSAALLRLGSAVRQHVALHAPAHVFDHAGVVAGGDGAIVLPGSSRSGKTTLVAELVRAGATYYSDEYAPVDADGLIQL